MINNQNIAVLSEKVAALEAAIKSAGIELPSVTTDDNGKTLQVVAGKWDKGMKIPELPSVTSEDNGKVLQVVEGAWATGSDLDKAAITLTGDYVGDITGNAFVKEGVAFIDGYFHTSEGVTAGTIGSLNVIAKNGTQWIGLDTNTGSIVRGYISANSSNLVVVGSIVANHDISIFCIFEIK